MKRCLLFLLLLLFGCKAEEEQPIAHEQEEFVIASPKEVTQPEQKQIAKPRRRVVPTPTPALPEPEAVPIEKETPIEEPTEEVKTALNRTVFEESFGWRAMNAVPMPAPPKHPDSLKWEDISGGYGAYIPPPSPWWVQWLGYINMAAAIILCGYLLITNG
jgi:hypothetical protein